MKKDIFDLYVAGVEFASIVIAVTIVLLTSPVWAFCYLIMNTSKIINPVMEKMEKKWKEPGKGYMEESQKREDEEQAAYLKEWSRRHNAKR